MEIREEKAAIIGIFIKDFDAVPKVNGILHDYAEVPLLTGSVRFPASLDELKGSRQRPCRRIYRRISL